MDHCTKRLLTALLDMQQSVEQERLVPLLSPETKMAFLKVVFNKLDPRFIETVPRKGYRFIAPAELAHIDAPSITTEIRIESQEQILDDQGAAIRRVAPSSVPSERIHSESREKRRGLPWWAVLLISVVAGMAIYGFWPRPEPYVIRVQQLSHSGQVDPWGKLVTDGSRIQVTWLISFGAGVSTSNSSPYDTVAGAFVIAGRAPLKR